MADPNVPNQSSPIRRNADAENAQAVSRSDYMAERDSLERAKDYTLRDRTRDIEENSMGNLHFGTPGEQDVGAGDGAVTGGGVALGSVVVPQSSIEFEPDAVLFQAVPQFDPSGTVDAQAAADIGLAPLAQRLSTASSDLNEAPARTLISGDADPAGFSAEGGSDTPGAGLDGVNGALATAQSGEAGGAAPDGADGTGTTGDSDTGEDPAPGGDTDTDTTDLPVLQVITVDVPENAAAGTEVGTISIDGASDGYSFAIRGAGADYFEISGQDIVVRSGVEIDHEALARIPLEIVATGPDGTVLTDAVSVDVLDVNEAPTALALSSTNVDENVSGGTVVAILTASDEDEGESFSYALSGADAGLFEIVGDELRVRTGATIDYETDDTFDLTVTVTDSGGSVFSRDVQISVNDILEAGVGPVSDTDVAANTLAENAADGSTVGVTALATDLNVEDTVSYSVDDNRFTVDANGVVRVAAGASFDAETEGSIDIVVTATSTDGSTSQETFTIAVSDIDEFDVGAVTDADGTANTIAENATVGTTVGVTALASDADVTDTVSYSVDDNRFTVDANGVVRVASGASFDAETEGSIDIVVTATSTDGSTSQETFSIAVSDIDEFDVGAVTDTDGTANTIAENATVGTTVGVTALASDADVTDTVSYSVDDNRFTVDSNGVVRVAAGASFDAETEGSIDIVVTATSTDGSTSQETFTIAVSDIDEFDVGAVTDTDGTANTIAEDAGAGITVGVTASASDADVTDTVSYTVDDNRFTVDANGVVKVASGASFDYETEMSIDVVVTATSTDGSTSQETFTIAVSDVDEAGVGSVTDTNVSANTIAENAAAGDLAGITAFAQDGDGSDTVSYSVDDARFAIDANGVVKVAAGASFDAETEGSVDIVVTATSTDGSTSQKTFTIAVSDIDEFDVGAVTDSDGAANTITENATVGTTVGVTALASDADVTDTVGYSVDDNRFTVDANGVVKVASGASFDAETEGSIDIVVTATSTDGSTSQETFTIAVSDIDEFDVGAVTDANGAANTIAENATVGTTVGVTALASDADITDTVSYAVDDNRFTVDSNGVVRVAGGASFDAETEGSIDIVVTATSTDGSTSQETFTIAVSDIDEFDVGAVTDTDGAANTIAENATVGTTVGVTALASDADVTDTVSYSVDDNRFTVDANGVVKVASGASFDAETEGSIDIVVTATSTDGSTSQETFTIAVSDIDEFNVGAVTDADGAANTIAENATVGTTVGVTALASDADITDTVSYAVDDNRFTVDANGVVKVASGASFDAETEGSIDIVVTATSTDGSTSQETFTIAVSDIDEFDVGAVTDNDGAANTIAENAIVGTTVGVTALASDADITDTVSYAVDDNRFTVDANGVVRVASGASFDAETEGSIDIVVTATSTDGSTSQETFTIAVSDIDEFNVGAVADTDGTANTIAENATVGTTVGVTALASDADITDTVSYSVDDNRFTVDANGVVRVASGASFDAETEGSIDIVVTATSTDGSTSQETFTIAVSDIDEFNVGAVTDADGAANTIAENATAGTTVGVTALANDADITDTVSYSVDDNRFTVDANGVVKVASGASFDAETEGSIDIVVTATSTDGSTSQETFTIAVSDIDEFNVGAVTDADGAANTIAENASAGATVGVTALATDADVTDNVSYAVDDNRFMVDGNGVVRVASGASFDAETEGSIDIVVTATSDDGSTSQETFTIAVSDIDEFNVGAVTDADGASNTIAENATAGTTVGVTALANDADITDTVSYAVDDNRFTVDANGVVKVASGASFDAETEGSIDIVVTATSTDGSTSQETFTIAVSDIDEFNVGAVTDADGAANTIAENATVGTTVGVTALASDADITDTVSYSVDDNRFTVDANGVVKVASGASFDAETEGSIDIVVTATSTDGSTSQETFTIAVSDIDEFNVGAVTDTDGTANTIAENATVGTTVGVTALASDADITDTVSYAVDDNRFTVDANGVVKVASGASFDAETEGSIDIVVTATSTDGSTSQETFTIAVSDIDEFNVGAVTDADGAANTIAENATVGTTVGVTALASDADITDTVSYSVDDNRFTVDANGVVKVASGASFDAETEGSIDIVVTATSTDGSTSQETFTIAVSDIDEFNVGAVTDADGAANTIAENATVGTAVGVTALASDADITDTVSYAVDDNRFTVDANGVVKVASGASFDAETEGSIDIVVTATSTDGSTSQETFTIAVSDIDEFNVGAVTDADGAANTIAENATVGTTVGVTVLASDADVTDTVGYSVDDNRFTIDANGVVKVASGASFDAETEGSIDIVVTATSTDGSTSQETFTIAVSDIDEFNVGAVTDADGAANTIAENATVGTTVGVTALASDADITDTVSYAVDDNRFTVDANGVVKVASGASFDAETEGSIDIVVTATSTDGSTSQETFTIAVSDIDEFNVSAVTDADGAANTIAENATVGTTVGVTALASDADITDTVSYSVDDNRFTVDANGIVKVASGASFDAETEGSIDIVVTATSTDGSTSQETFTIAVSDIDEFNVGAVTDADGAANTIAENATVGTTVGVTALASDADVTDTVSYSVDDNRFTVDANGVVRVASGASFDAETEGSIDIVVTATSTDGSTSQETFTIAVSDIDEFNVGAVTDADGAANTIAENATVGTTVGVTALASDADITDTVSYAVDDNRFTVDANGVVRVASGASFDAETEGSIDIVVTATSTDGSTSQETFTIAVSDIDEFDVGAVTDTDGTANTIAENATVGTTVGVTASASDADITDTVTYSVDDSRFTVDANGVVKVASGATFDHETEDSIAIVVTATSTDGSASQETFTIGVSDVNEGPSDLHVYGRSNSILTNGDFESGAAANVGAGNEANFTSIDGWTSTSADTFTVRNENWTGAGLDGTDKAARGDYFIEINDDDGGGIQQTVATVDGQTYTLSIDLAPRPGFDATDNTLQIYWNGQLVDTISEDATSATDLVWTTHSFTVTGAGTSGTLTLVSPDGTNAHYAMQIDNVTLSADNGTMAVDENSAAGTVVATLGASDVDAGDTHTYAIVDSGGNVVADSNFEIVGNEIRVKAGADLDFETDTSHTLHVRVTDSGGLTHTEAVTINVNDVLEIDLSANALFGADAPGENTAGQATATGGAGGAVTYSLANDAGGLFAIDSSTGEITFNEPSTFSFNQQTGSDNPFNGIDIGNEAAPTFADIDNDGDLDMFVGNETGNIRYYENTGTSSAPTFTYNAENPFGLADVGGDATPTFVDIDNDGDLDLFVGNHAGDLKYYQNTGTASSPTYTFVGNDHFGLNAVSGDVAASFVDIDNDGDLDAFIGLDDGTLEFFRNSGSATAPSFTSEGVNAFGLTDVGSNAKPTFVDADGDGDMDAFVGRNDGQIEYFENTGSVTAPTLVSQGVNQFGTSDVGSQVRPAFADLDGDGDLDMIAGEDLGTLNYFENAPVANAQPDVQTYSIDVQATNAAGSVNESVTVSIGTSGAETITGGSGTDLIYGMGGNDSIVGGAGDDAIGGGSGSDTIAGGDGNDVLFGGAGTDTLSGGSGDDLLVGDGDPFLAGGGTEFVANTYTSSNQQFGEVTALKDGGFLVVWESYGQDGSGEGVYAQRYDSSGNASGSEFRVNTETSGNQMHPDVTTLEDGSFVITWKSFGQDGSDNGIYGQKYSADGTTSGAEFRVNSTTSSSQADPRVEALDGGGYVVVWEADGQDGSGMGIYSQVYDANNNTVGGETRVNTTTTNTQTDPRVTAIQGGGYVVVWEDNSSGSFEVMAQRYDSSGTASGAEFRVNTTTTDKQDDAEVAGLADGSFVVVWESMSQDGSSNGLFAQLYDANGNATGSEFQVNTTTNDYQQDHRIEALSDGGFVVTWEGGGSQDGSGQGIFAQEFDSSGTAVGVEQQLNTTTSGDQSNPAIAQLTDGRLVTIWDSSSQDASGTAIVGRIFGEADSSDYITAGAGNDTLQGGVGNDTLLGEAGNDSIIGGAGNDQLVGGAGDDTLVGGEGDDLFVFDAGDGVDTAIGGTGGWTDTIQLGDGAGSIGDISVDWTLQLDSGSIDTQSSGEITLSEDASGTITLNDGSQLHFQEIERIVF